MNDFYKSSVNIIVKFDKTEDRLFPKKTSKHIPVFDTPVIERLVVFDDGYWFWSPAHLSAKKFIIIRIRIFLILQQIFTPSLGKT
jgi:hypothetical protein